MPFVFSLTVVRVKNNKCFISIPLLIKLKKFNTAQKKCIGYKNQLTPLSPWKTERWEGFFANSILCIKIVLVENLPSSAQFYVFRRIKRIRQDSLGRFFNERLLTYDLKAVYIYKKNINLWVIWNKKERKNKLSSVLL